MATIINSKTTLRALLAEGAELQGFHQIKTPNGETVQIDPLLARSVEGCEPIAPPRGGWVGFRVSVQVEVPRGANWFTLATSFILESDAKRALTNGYGFLGLDRWARIVSQVSEVDLPWVDYYPRALSVLRSISKTRLRRMPKELLLDVAVDLYRLSYGVSSVYKVKIGELNGEYFVLDGDNVTTTRDGFVANLLAWRAAAIVRLDAIAHDLEQAT